MRADAERNNASILRAARDLVRARGADVSMEEIAAAAGVAVGTLYRHHPTKAALLDAVIARSLEGWAAHAEAAAAHVADGGDPAEALADLIRTIAVSYAADRTLKAAADALASRAPESLTGPFAAGSIESRVLAATEAVLDAAHRARAVRDDFGLADLALLIGGVPDGESAASRYTDLVLSGVLAPSMRHS